MDIKNFVSSFIPHIKKVVFLITSFALIFGILYFAFVKAAATCTQVKVDGISKWQCCIGSVCKTELIRENAEKAVTDAAATPSVASTPTATASTGTTAKSTEDLTASAASKTAYANELNKSLGLAAASDSSSGNDASDDSGSSQSSSGSSSSSSNCANIGDSPCPSTNTCQCDSPDGGYLSCVNGRYEKYGTSPACKNVSSPVSGSNPAASGSPSSTANSSAADIQCSGACDNKAGHTCGWQASTQRHCYCLPNSDSTIGLGKFQLNNNLKEYCTYCAWDKVACTCSYTKYGQTEEKTIDMQNKACDISGTPLENYEIVCANPGGAADENACLNSKCAEGTGCGTKDTGCEKMNQEILTLIDYHEGDKVALEGTNNLSKSNGECNEGDSECADVKKLLDNIKKYGLSAQAILSHVFVDKADVAGTNDIACASTNAKTCGDERNGQIHTCVSVNNAATSMQSCYVWSWAKGLSQSCPAELGCSYNQNNQNLNQCKTKVSSEGLSKCEGSDGWYDSGKSKCGNCDGGFGFCYCNNGTWQMKGEPCSRSECDPETGCSSLAVKQQCKAGTFPCDLPSECVENCGSGYDCEITKSSGSKSSGYTNTYNDEDYTASGKKGFCTKKTGEDGEEENEELQISNAKANGNDKNCPDGIMVSCTTNVKAICTVTDPWNNSKSDSGSTSHAICMKNKSDSSSSSSNGNIKFSIHCEDVKDRSNTDDASATCDGDTLDKENTYNPESATSTDDTEKDKEEQKKQDSTAPKVTVSKPGANETISAKTAELSVTTDINATCKYMDSKNGSFTSSNFDGSGMSMNGSGGTTHTATLSNLTEGTASDCKYNHTIVVLCKNSKASSDSSKTTGAIGSGQTSFVVDLSKNTENAPKVTNATDGKYAIANPVLKVTTDRPADCEYKEGSSFTFSSGKKFDSTGSYNHSAQLSGLTDKDYDYYVVCKDKETCAQNTAVEVKFTVALPGNASTTLAIVSTTPENQTVANPTLSVSTDLPATCQYKKDSTFIYGDSGAKQFANDADYSHTAALPAAEYPDGKYTFYVACKAKDSGASKTLGQAIITTIKRSGDVAGAPVISNTTPNNQTTSTSTLSITTSAAATCQYKEGGEFTYGSGIQFTTDGGTGHSVQLADVSDGQHTFYVACKDTATNAVNSAATQIIFTVTTAQTCANLETNDKQNDNDRDVADEDDATDSDYLWRSMEAGTRDKFTKVDWYAGYQFTPEKDGQVTQLCGYFGDGNSNRVSLYSGSYAELASVQISGTGGWKCASISPVPVKTDKRYYVITRVQDGPIYYEYKSGLLPRDNDNATVESGIRQLAGEKFGSNVKKYDYMVFGLVDARIKFEAENTDGPEVDTAIPVGTISDNNTVISVATNINATCKYDRDDVDYNDMKYTFAKTGAKVHEQKVCNLDDGPFTFYVRCKGTTGTNNASTLIQFEVSD